MLADKNQKFYHTFLESYIYRNKILAYKALRKQLYHIFLELHINQEKKSKEQYQNTRI